MANATTTIPNTNKTLCTTCHRPVAYFRTVLGKWAVRCACGDRDIKRSWER